jgi:hypothetical protein
MRKAASAVSASTIEMEHAEVSSDAAGRGVCRREKFTQVVWAAKRPRLRGVARWGERGRERS